VIPAWNDDRNQRAGITDPGYNNAGLRLCARQIAEITQPVFKHRICSFPGWPSLGRWK
jgi:hypothetical protein